MDKIHSFACSFGKWLGSGAAISSGLSAFLDHPATVTQIVTGIGGLIIAFLSYRAKRKKEIKELELRTAESKAFIDALKTGKVMITDRHSHEGSNDETP